MKANIVKIGNSRGIRIPKSLIDQCGFENEVDMEVHNHELLIRSTHQPRKGWAESFKAMANHGDDALLDLVAKSSSTWDHKEWEWK